MNYLQTNNIRHLDLKPSNILLTGCLNVKIADFDFSDYTGKDEQDGAVIGKEISRITFEYAAPEFMTGKHYPNSDVFSFGLVVYYLIFEKDYWHLDIKDRDIKNREGDIKILSEFYSKSIKIPFNKDHKKPFDKDLQKEYIDEKIFDELKKRNLKYEEPLMNILEQCLKIEHSDRKSFQGIIGLNKIVEILEEDKKCGNKIIDNAVNDIWEKSKKIGCVGVRVCYGPLFEEMENFITKATKIEKINDDVIKKSVYAQIVQNYEPKSYRYACDSDTKKMKDYGIEEDRFKNFMRLYGHVLIKEDLGVHPFKYLADNLWNKCWYFDANKPNETTAKIMTEKEKIRDDYLNSRDQGIFRRTIRSYQNKLENMNLQDNEEDIAVNLFLVRNGVAIKESFTLEFTMNNFKSGEDIKKLSFTSLFDLLNFIKSGNGYVERPFDINKDKNAIKKQKRTVFAVGRGTSLSHMIMNEGTKKIKKKKINK